jgi:hypothetical protein
MCAAGRHAAVSRDGAPVRHSRRPTFRRITLEELRPGGAMNRQPGQGCRGRRRSLLSPSRDHVPVPRATHTSRSPLAKRRTNHRLPRHPIVQRDHGRRHALVQNLQHSPDTAVPRHPAPPARPAPSLRPPGDRRQLPRSDCELTVPGAIRAGQRRRAARRRSPPKPGTSPADPSMAQHAAVRTGRRMRANASAVGAGWPWKLLYPFALARRSAGERSPSRQTWGGEFSDASQMSTRQAVLQSWDLGLLEK